MAEMWRHNSDYKLAKKVLFDGKHSNIREKYSQIRERYNI
jgi:hypothetical protein